MEHTGHFATGAAAGAALSVVADGAHTLITGVGIHPGAYLITILATGGAALLPDLDHDKSMFTKSGGPITRVIAEGLQLLSRRVYAATRMPCDPPAKGKQGEHRGLLHTWPAAVAVGSIIAATASVMIPRVNIPIGAVVLALVLAPGLRSLALSSGFKWLAFMRSRVRALITATSFAFPIGTLTGPEAFPFWLFGLAIAAGMFVHTLGDGGTRHGVPLKWPFKGRCDKHQAAGAEEKCARWDRSHTTPRVLRFSTGTKTGRANEQVIAVLCAVFSLVVPPAGIILI